MNLTHVYGLEANKRNDMSIPSMVGRGELKQKLPRNACSFMFFGLTNRCKAIEAEKRPTAEKIVEELKDMKEQVVGF